MFGVFIKLLGQIFIVNISYLFMKKSFRKKGVSTIVATVLIVLVTIAGAGIVGVSVYNLFSEDPIQEIPSLFIENSEGYTFWDEENKTMCVQIGRGDDDADFEKLQIIFDNTNGNSKTFLVPYTNEQEIIPKINEKKVYCFNSLNEIPSSIKIAAVFSNGKVTEILDSLDLIKSGNVVGEMRFFDEYGDSINKDGFIFTYWPIGLVEKTSSFYASRMQAREDMKNAGMNYAGILILPFYDSWADEEIADLKSQGYKLALEYSAGHYENNPLPELEDVYGDGAKQYLTADCLDRDKCENWNSSHALNPQYTGILWQNTLENLRNVVVRAQPELVLIDTELWQYPKSIDYLFTDISDPGDDCDCSIVKDGIGYDAYNSAWFERGLEVKETIEDSWPTSEAYFYHELAQDSGKCWPNLYGYCASSSVSLTYLPGTGDSASPSMYFAANLEMLENYISWSNMTNSLPWVSFSYVMGYSNICSFKNYKNQIKSCIKMYDIGVSREAGRMLAQSGARGFVVYPNAFNEKESYGNEWYEHWLEHAEAMIQGFNEAKDYIETNKIRNPDFEAYKAVSQKTEKINGINYLYNTTFFPVFWDVNDTNPSFIHNFYGSVRYVPTFYPGYLNLSEDKVSGMYSWQHSRKGDLGNRTINSQNFTISFNEKGNYKFSIYTKSSVSSNNGKFIFIIVNKNTKEEKEIGSVSLNENWNNFEEIIFLDEGEYLLKIIIEDKTLKETDFYLDNVILEKI